MKLSCFELLSPDPVFIRNIGSILSPRLRDISALGFRTYQYYLSVLLMDLKSYLSLIGQGGKYELFTEEDRAQINLFDLILMNEQSTALLLEILNFFIREEVTHCPGENCLTVKKDQETVGMITAANYPLLCDLICQRNYIRSRRDEDPSKVKSKKAAEILKKLQKGRDRNARQSTPDQNMELGNIISAVANKSQSLNILNIWDLTVYQLWDCFSRLSSNSIYAIQSMSVAAWGNKDHSFDASAWFKRIDTIN